MRNNHPSFLRYLVTDGWHHGLSLGLQIIALIVLGFSLWGCTITGRLPPPAPEAVKVLVPVTKACTPATVTRQPRPVDDKSILSADFPTTVKGLVVSWLMEAEDNTKLRAANDRPCGE